MFIEFFRGTKTERSVLHSRDQLRSRVNLNLRGRERLAGLELEAKNISRKLLLRRIGAAAGIALIIAAGVAVWSSSNTIQDSERQDPPAVTTTISTYYPLRDKLTDWDTKIASGSIDFLAVAPQIADLASQTLCREIECDPSYEKPALDLQNNREFKRTFFLDNPCDTDINPDDDSLAQGFAYSKVLTGDLFFNTDYLQYTDIQRKIKRQNTASRFFQIYMHEELHNRAKSVTANQGELVYVPEDSESYPLIMRRGFRSLYRSYKYYSRSEEGCILGLIHERLLEEAVVDYATQEILRNMDLILSTPYQNLIQQYRVRVLNPFFEGNYKRPLRFHQNTDQNGFYLALGGGIARERGVSLSPEQQISEAKSYIAGALNLSLQ